MAGFDTAPNPNTTATTVGIPATAQTQDAPTPDQIPQGNVPPVPQAPPVNPQAAAAATNVASHAATGKLARFLLGNEVDYQVNPESGKMEEVPVPQKPGQLMRGILAGALLGATSGAKGGGGTFWGGVGAGGGAVDQRNQEMRKERMAAAQQQFENQQKLSQNAREDERLKIEKNKADAETALWNSQMVYHNKLTAGLDFSQHEADAKAGATMLDTYVAAGVKPAYSNIREEELPTLQKNNPEAQKYMWIPTGTYTKGRDANGNVQYGYTYSAIDRNSKARLSDAMIKEYEKVGVKDMYAPGEWAAIKHDKQLSPDEAYTLNHNYLVQANQYYALQQQKLAEDEKRGLIDLHKAEYAKAVAEKQAALTGMAEAKKYSEIMDKLNKGATWETLGTGDKQIVADQSKRFLEVVQKNYDDIQKEIDKAELAGQKPDQTLLDEQKKILNQEQSLQYMIRDAEKWMPKDTAVPKPTQAGQVPTRAEAEAYGAVPANQTNGKPDLAKVGAAMRADGWNVPQPAPPSPFSAQTPATAPQSGDVGLGNVASPYRLMQR